MVYLDYRLQGGGWYCEVIHNPATDSSITSSIKASVQ